MRKPESLEVYRAVKERLSHWYYDFQQFLLLDDIGNDPRNFWNADESIAKKNRQSAGRLVPNPVCQMPFYSPPPRSGKD